MTTKAIQHHHHEAGPPNTALAASIRASTYVVLRPMVTPTAPLGAAYPVAACYQIATRRHGWGRTNSTAVSCGSCGSPMDPIVATDSKRGPCAKCGGIGIAIAIGIAEEIDIASELEVGYGPADHERDAARRWRDADAEVRALEQPLTNDDRDAIHDAQRRLHAVFVDLWSLRETLIDEHSVPRQQVDAVISGSPSVIALGHDLGNVAKHGSPLASPRSGHQPTFGQPLALRPGSGGAPMFQLNVEYDGRTVNGVNIARQVIDEWRRWMAGWGVL